MVPGAARAFVPCRAPVYWQGGSCGAIPVGDRHEVGRPDVPYLDRLVGRNPAQVSGAASNGLTPAGTLVANAAWARKYPAKQPSTE
jgi:hypothetical protein